ncbi:MAG: hypothetical protein IT437_01760 [Phycisphaerales bacterium]|nr:hypothetical protein [Phycisphaerales bacterium]
MRSRAAHVALLLVLAAACPGQDQPKPSEDPAINDPSVPRRAQDMDNPHDAGAMPPTAAPKSDPVVPNDPAAAVTGLEVADYSVGRAPLRREGTFLVRRRASMIHLRTGDWALVFHKDDRGDAERAMLITPCTNLARMEHMAADSEGPMSFLLSGQVYVYEGRNYFLPTVPPVAVVQTAEPTPPGSEDGDLVEGPQPDERNDPDTDDLLRELEAQRDAPRSIGSIAPAPPAPANSARTDPLPEGTVISRRRGRLVRQADGQTALVMNTDSDTDPAADPPLTLAPSLMRERMESQSARTGDTLVFEVSGRVLAYQGRNYLLPSMFLVYPASELLRRE